MTLSTTHDAIMERIGQTLVDVSEDMATEPLPKGMKALLEPPSVQANIACMPSDALANPGRYSLVERRGELLLSQLD